MTIRPGMTWTLRAAALGVLIGVFICGGTGRAADFTWSATPGSGLWTSAANWSPDTGPPSTPDRAIFSASAVTSISLGGPGVNSLQFNAGAPAYSFSLTGPATFTISGDIVNNSANRPTFTLSATSPNLAKLLFEGTAANAIIINNSGGNTQFVGFGTAANASITNNTGGETQFSGVATAGNATISNDTVGTSTTFSGISTGGNATITNSTLGTTTFTGGSTAGTANITNNFLGFTNFQDSSSAGSATITTNANGTTEFEGSSSGGLAQLIVTGMGVVDISDLATPGMTVGSIAGAPGGAYELGSKTLTVGGNNASTTESATIEDGGAAGGTGGALIKVGTGTLTLTVPDTYSGGTSFDGGTVAVSNDDNLGTGPLTFNGGTLEALAGIVSSKAVTLASGGGTFLANPATVSTLSGAISGGGFLILNGSGTLVLSGANTYRGATLVESGILKAGSTTGLSPNSTFIVNSLLDLNGFNSAIGSLSGSGIVTNNGASPARLTAGGDNTSTTFSGSMIDGVTVPTFTDSITPDLAVSLGFTKAGTGTMILSGANTYSGGTTITGGTLQIGAGGTTGSIVGNVINNAALAFDRSDSITFAGTISGTGALIKEGTGSLMLTGTDTYGGGTSFDEGTVAVTSDSNLGTGALIFNGGTLEALAAGGGIVSSKAVTLASGGGTFLADPGTVSALSGAISGGGSLILNGTGTLVLSGANTYSGSTQVESGTLKPDSTTGLSPNSTFNVSSLLDLNGFNSAIGSLAGAGIVTNSGRSAVTLTAGGNNASTTFSGTMTDGPTASLGFTKTGTGTMILSGANTYSGGTVLNAGTLIVNNAHALGLGNIVVNGGILRADPQPINVKLNYTQTGGTLQLQIAGANPGQYDTLNVGGNATLGGTLQLLSLGFQPVVGDRLTLVSTGGQVINRFAQFVDPFAGEPGLNVELLYGSNSVVLEFLLNFKAIAQTPNQRAAANIVDSIQQNPKAANLISFLNSQPVSELPGDLDQISPDALTALYDITFSNSNIQRLNLESRLDDARAGSNGFNSNMKIQSATVNLEDKAPVNGKASPVEQALQSGPENRWGVWMTGFGDFVNVDADYNAKAYNFTTGGFTAGIDYRLTDYLAVGAMGGYSHTWTNLTPAGSIDVDSGRGGVYLTWFGHGFYLDGAIYGGHNVYSSSRAALGGMANGGTSGAEFSTFVGAGYDWHAGNLTIGPIASLQYTYTGIDSFTENGSLAPMAIHSQSAESLRTDFGFRASYNWQVGKVLVEPMLQATWEHEYKYTDLPLIAAFAGQPNAAETFVGPNEGHDSAIISTGVTAYWTPTIATYIDYDGQLGRDHYNSNTISGGVRISL